MRLMRAFLWIAVVGWAIGFGAKLFDLVVVAGAWSSSPPASFALLPYGKRYPINPGDFFQPLSVLMAIRSIGALISGWKSRVRLWLWLPVIMFFHYLGYHPDCVLAHDSSVIWHSHRAYDRHRRRVGAACASLACLRFISRALNRDRFHRIRSRDHMRPHT
jgi:hypothetical protein